MIEITDKEIATPQILKEIKALGLARRFGVRRTKGVGIVVKGDFTEVEEAKIRQAVKNHVPAPPPTAQEVDRASMREEALLSPFARALTQRMARAAGITVPKLLDELDAEL